MYSRSWQQIVLCQAIQASQRIMSGGLIQIPLVKKACLAKQEWSTDAYSSLFVTIHYTLFDLFTIRYSSWKAS